jgi:hypothetical protein
MPSIPLNQLVPVLQLAVSPVILISGVGLLLLTLTNRFGRLLDRARQLNHERKADGTIEAGVATQIDILHRRAGILRTSVTLGAVTLLLVAVLILALFVAALCKIEAGWFIVTLFCLSQIALIGCLFAFIHDMNLALAAVRLEIRR